MLRTQFIGVAFLFAEANAFWRMNCGTVQLSRIDPIVSPGGVSGHVHIVAGPNSENNRSGGLQVTNLEQISGQAQITRRL